jgi:hypothetical protein
MSFECCPFCGPRWCSDDWEPLPDPEPEPEAEDELLSYWVALGKEPTHEERMQSLEADITELEQTLQSLEDKGLTPSVELRESVKRVRKTLTDLQDVSGNVVPPPQFHPSDELGLDHLEPEVWDP